jgi:hypothetical protein
MTASARWARSSPADRHQAPLTDSTRPPTSATPIAGAGRAFFAFPASRWLTLDVDISPQRLAAWPRTTDPSAVERLVSLGASIVAGHKLGDHGWTVTHDPELYISSAYLVYGLGHRRVAPSRSSAAELHRLPAKSAEARRYGCLSDRRCTGCYRQAVAPRAPSPLAT